MTHGADASGPRAAGRDSTCAGSDLDRLPLDDVEPLTRGHYDERTTVLDADPALLVPDVAD